MAQPGSWLQLLAARQGGGGWGCYYAPSQAATTAVMKIHPDPTLNNMLKGPLCVAAPT
jgi:hypothetical protein